MANQKKETPTQTLSLLLEHLGLPKGATSEDISIAIAQREEAAKASASTRPARPKWTPYVTSLGEVAFARTRVRLAADEIDTLKAELDSKEFATFCATNADSLADRKAVSAAKREAKAARKAAKEAEGE